LARDGYGGLSVDGVAVQAGVSKASIYRRWASKRDLVVAAARDLSRTVPVPDTGDVRDDLAAIVGELARVFAAPGTVGLVAALVSGMAADRELATAFRDGFLSVRRDATRTVLERARERGEISPDLDLDVVIDLLAAPLYYRLLITGDPIDDRFASNLVDAVVASSVRRAG
jgi:AcrR family transcriptional regulator